MKFDYVGTKQPTIIMRTDFGIYDVVFDIGKYVADGSVAIKSFSFEEGPIATLTVCLNDKTLAPDEAYVDTNNCPWAPMFLQQNKLGSPTGIMRPSGFCVYPQYKFNLDELNKYAVKGD